MDYKIRWTKRAEDNFHNVVEYIEIEWGANSAKRFVRKVYKLLDLLKKQPLVGKIEVEQKGIRSFVFSKQNTLFYRIKEQQIIILAIFDNRKDPQNRLK